MQDVLTGILRECCFVYLDDIMVYTANRETHLGHLDHVLRRMQMHHLTCTLTKCHFGREEVSFLGHQITSDGNLPQQQHRRMHPDEGSSDYRSSNSPPLRYHGSRHPSSSAGRGRKRRRVSSLDRRPCSCQATAWSGNADFAGNQDCTYRQTSPWGASGTLTTTLKPVTWEEKRRFVPLARSSIGLA